MFQSRIVNHGIRVEERKRIAPAVRCFEGEIRQVISNLVSNAIDAMQPLGGGRLLLRSRVGRDWNGPTGAHHHRRRYWPRYVSFGRETHI